MQKLYEQLIHIKSHDELALYQLIPAVVWIFDIDKHGWWWGNEAAIEFWGLDSIEDLIDKDLSDDTQGARDRTLQTFELAARDGLHSVEWTTYPNGKPTTVMMMHRAVLLGDDKHRGIIAFINQEVNLGEQPENLLLMEAMRYTHIPATTFDFSGAVVVDNPTASEMYKHIHSQLDNSKNHFVARFASEQEGVDCLQKIKDGQEGRWEYQMKTVDGLRCHSLDVRRKRHPLTGEFLFLVLEYDLTDLQQALAEVEEAKQRLHDIAMKDTLTGVHSLHYMQEVAKTEIARAIRHKQNLCVLFIDLDGFKAVNDTMGHDAGDQVLCEVAKRIQAEIRTEDLLARLGGDEFVVLLSKPARYDDVDSITSRIVKGLNSVIMTSYGVANISASIGVAQCPKHGEDLETLLKAADKAMYKVKKSTKNDFALAE